MDENVERALMGSLAHSLRLPNVLALSSGDRPTKEGGPSGTVRAHLTDDSLHRARQLD
jgi:hypothetical protein